MGNPAAALKLVEYGSMTCPHCGRFDETGASILIADYVKPGKVSYEFRNYVRDSLDLTAALVARCNGAATFFPITRALFHDQQRWIARVTAQPEERIKAIDGMPLDRRFGEIADIAGLPQYAHSRGVAPTRTAACLADTKAVDELVKIAGRATTDFPDFPGTPTFLLNGELLDGVATWPDLESRLKAALGG